MKRIKLQEGRRSSERKIIYEGKGVCRVMKGGRLVERFQLEKGDNLLEALKGGKLMEGNYPNFEKDSEDPSSPGYFVTDDDGVIIQVFDFEEDGGALVLYRNDKAIWNIKTRSAKEAMELGNILTDYNASTIYDDKAASRILDMPVRRGGF